MNYDGADCFFLKNHLSSIMEITDIYQNTVKTYDYDAYVNILGEDGSLAHNAFTYTAREYHPRSGLYYYRARWYDPEIGRFITQDPIGFLGGMNLYVYVANDPVNWIDPWGLWDESYRTLFSGPPAGTVGPTWKDHWDATIGESEGRCPPSSIVEDFVRYNEQAMLTQSIGNAAAAGFLFRGLDLAGNVISGQPPDVTLVPPDLWFTNPYVAFWIEIGARLAGAGGGRYDPLIGASDDLRDQYLDDLEKLTN